jgi:GTP-binding protein
MIVTSSEHVRTITATSDLSRDPFPQVAFMGRSNVGKSSLINRLLGARGLARTSKTPGRTRAIQVFRVNDRYDFVDLPGYGYARVPRPMRKEWQGLIESYLEGPWGPDLAIVLVDARREPSEVDQELLTWLRSRHIPARVVLTKIDKLPRAQRGPAVTRTAAGLGLDADAPPLASSVITGDGLNALWKVLDEALSRGGHGTLHPQPAAHRAEATHRVHSGPQHQPPPVESTRKRTRP